MYLGLLVISEEKLGEFGVELDGETCLYLSFVIIFKIMSFGVIFCMTGFDGLPERILLRLSI